MDTIKYLELIKNNTIARDEIEIRLIKNNNKDIEECLNTMFNFLINDYYNLFEAMCYKYINNKCDKREFEELWGKYIVDIVEQDKEKFEKKDCNFKNLLKVYEKSGGDK